MKFAIPLGLLLGLGIVALGCDDSKKKKANTKTEQTDNTQENSDSGSDNGSGDGGDSGDPLDTATSQPLTTEGSAKFASEVLGKVWQICRSFSSPKVSSELIAIEMKGGDVNTWTRKEKIYSSKDCTGSTTSTGTDAGTWKLDSLGSDDHTWNVDITQNSRTSVPLIKQVISVEDDKLYFCDYDQTNTGASERCAAVDTKEPHVSSGTPVPVSATH